MSSLSVEGYFIDQGHQLARQAAAGDRPQEAPVALDIRPHFSRGHELVELALEGRGIVEGRYAAQQAIAATQQGHEA